MKLDISVKIFLIITALFVFIYAVAFFGRSNLPDVAYLDPSDPLLKEAKTQASETLDTFYQLYPKYQDKAFVRFKFLNAKNEEEHVWGKVLEMNEKSLRITDINKKDERDNLNYPKFYDISKPQIEDWIINYENDSVRGGFTTQVILLRKMQDQPQQVDTLKKQIGLFIDELR